MASSSSSQQRNRGLNAFSGIVREGERRMVSESSRVFDVFINHRGPDVKNTLAGKLYNSLKERGIWAFLDSEEKELGISFPSAIEIAIRSAKVHIAIFPPRYAESPWCLAGLALMLQSAAKIITVFYQVKPSDLRHIETGVYAEAFNIYEQKGRYLEELNAWKEALGSLSLIAGEEFNSECDCQKIVAAVQKEVQRKTCLHVAEYPVGLNNLVSDFNRRCLDELVQDFEDRCWQEKGKHKTQVVGIFGMGGAGKTTLAKELFNRKKSNYTRASFLFDVREASVKSDLSSLQSSLLKDLFHKEISFRRKEEGRSYLKDHLRRAPPLSSLIVVDDIDHVEQLNALVVKDILQNSDNTLVIVTTRDAGLLINAGITVGYNLKGMNRSYARELFCWHAFDQARPCNGYEVLVDSLVDVCGGLPLSLQVMGRHVNGRDHRFWELVLIKAQKMLPQDVKQRLRISFDALDDEEKQIFKDIACLFLGKQRSVVESILEGLGWSVHHAMKRLKEKCLLENEIYSEGGLVLRMHDHLRDLGREMAQEFGPPHRLWRPQDLQSLEKMGFRNILAKTNIRCFHSFVDKSMGCRVTFFLGQPDTFFETSACLLWLQIKGVSKEPSIPAWISIQTLQFLEINCGGLKTFWENHTQEPSQLKELQICQCSALEELRLELLTFLRKIYIRDCENLKSVSGISNLASLVELEISHCSGLVFESLTLSGMKCLKSITIDGVGNLKYFRLYGCPKLKKIGFGYNQLIELSIRDCPALNAMPNFTLPSCLERIIIDGCGQLKCLRLRGCEKLKNVSVDIRDLFISGCPELEGLPSFGRLNCLELIGFESCEELQSLTLPKRLISLSVKSCRGLQRVTGFGDLSKLTQLVFKECPELGDLPSLARMCCLEKIEIDSCETLQNLILPASLMSISIKRCRGLERMAGIGDLLKLTQLIVEDCPELEELPRFAGVSYMEEIEIGSCDKLQSISGIKELHALQGMKLRFCSNSVIRNCIHELKCVPSRGMDMIGRAVDGAESSLNKNLFCDANINVHGMTDIGANPKWSELSPCEANSKWSELSAVVVCLVVVLDRSIWVEDINHRYKVPEGEWIITTVEYKCEKTYNYVKFEEVDVECEEGYKEVEYEERYKEVEYECEEGYKEIEYEDGYKAVEYEEGYKELEYEGSYEELEYEGIDLMKIIAILRWYKFIRKGLQIEVKRGEEWKCVSVLRTIVDKLHH